MAFLLMVSDPRVLQSLLHTLRVPLAWLLIYPAVLPSARGLWPCFICERDQRREGKSPGPRSPWYDFKPHALT